MAELQAEIGVRLKDARIQRGLSLEALGELSGLDKSTISRIENGKTKTLDVATLDRIAQALGLSLEKLLLVPESRQQGGAMGEQETEAAVAAVEALLRGFGLEDRLELRVKEEAETYTRPEPESLQSDESQVLKDYRTITSDKKTLVRELLRTLASTGTTDANSVAPTSNVEGGGHAEGEGRRVPEKGGSNSK